MPTVEYVELEQSMMFVSGGSMFDASARISRQTGEIFWLSDDSLDEERLPDDIDDDERYVEVPDKRELDLGKPLVMRFAGEFLPEQVGEIAAMFRRKGAYSRFRSFLERRGKLNAWYEYENAAVRVALTEWAREEGFEVTGVDEGPAA